TPANLDVGRKVAALRGARSVAQLDATRDRLHRNLATRAAIRLWIDRDAGARLLAADGVVRPVAAGMARFRIERLDAAKGQGSQVTGAFRDERGNRAVR